MCASGWGRWSPGESWTTTGRTEPTCFPAEHAAVLTDAAGTDDLALAMQSVPALGRAETELVRCFRTGAGLPADLLDEWNVLREEELARRQRASLVDEILPLVPGLVPRLQAGIDALDVGARWTAGAGRC